MKVVKYVAAIGVVMLLCHCGTLSPQQLCKEAASTLCTKFLECATDTAKKVLPFLKDQATCEAEMYKQNGCEESNVCKDGKTYNAKKAGDCINELKALSCEQFKQQREKNTPSCNVVCQ